MLKDTVSIDVQGFFDNNNNFVRTQGCSTWPAPNKSGSRQV